MIWAERAILRRSGPRLQRRGQDGPKNANVRMLRGSCVPDGCRGGLAGPADSRSLICKNRRPAPAPSKHARPGPLGVRGLAIHEVHEPVSIARTDIQEL